MRKNDISNRAVLRSALPKATGEATYTSDFRLPGCLYGRVVRSPQAHARILNVDLSAAKAVRGVRAVVTAKDVPGLNRLGKTRFDQPILADEKARCYLDALALIAAEDEEAALEAEGKIKLDLEPLPAVFSIEEATAPGAPLVHSDRPGNLLLEIHLYKGDVEQGFREADLVIEDNYQTPAIEHGYFEMDNGLITPHDDGSYTLWIGCHSTHAEKTILANTLNLPEEKVLVIQPYTGGSFGGKDDGLFSAYLGLLAYNSGQPVRLDIGRHEEFIAHTKRHPQWIQVKMGLREDGLITAVQFKLQTDTGAYAHWGEGIFTFASIGACGPYRIPHQKVDTQVFYTNNIPMGAMRAWGMPGVTFAMESHLDQAAVKLGMHPLQLRYLNAAEDGDQMITGSPFPPGMHIKDTIQAAASLAGVSLDG